MKYDELTIGRKVYALVNITGRTGWNADKSRWVTATIAKRGVSGSSGPVYVKKDGTIEDMYVWKSHGDYVLIVTVDGDGDAGEPSYTRGGQYYLVSTRNITDFAGYQKRTQAKRDKQAKIDADRSAKQDEGEALDTAWLLDTLRQHNASDEAIGLVQQMVNANELRVNRPWNWKPEVA